MAKNDEFDNPFNETDDSLVSVEPGAFDSAGAAQARTGATNARATQGGLAASWQGVSRERKVNLIAAIATAVVVLLVLPTVISIIGIGRRDALAAAEVEESQINFIVVSEQMRAAEDSVSIVLGAYAMSSAFAPEKERDEMRSRLDDMSEAVSDNDEQAAQGAAERAREYFVDTYAPALLGNVDSLTAEWSGADWEAFENVDAAAEKVSSNLSLDKIDSLGSAVIELANALGALRQQHYENLSSYVPPPPVVEPKETQEEKPKETVEETKEPEKTEEPKEETVVPEPEPEPTDGADDSADTSAGADADGADGDADGDEPDPTDGSSVDGDTSGETNIPNNGTNRPRP